MNVGDRVSTKEGDIGTGEIVSLYRAHPDQVLVTFDDGHVCLAPSECGHYEP